MASPKPIHLVSDMSAAPGLFENRADAGRQLAAALISRDFRNPLILALPRGGVPVAAEISRAMDAQIDLLIVRKLGAPGYPEYGVGAIVDGDDPQIVLNENVAAALQPSSAYLEQEKQRQLTEIERRRRRYLGSRAPVPVTGRNVILVDDGIATGGTVRTAIKALRRARAATITVAVPIAAPGIVNRVASEADDVVCLLQPRDFQAVGYYYRDFAQVGDSEVEAAMTGLRSSA